MYSQKGKNWDSKLKLDIVFVADSSVIHFTSRDGGEVQNSARGNGSQMASMSIQ